MWRGYLLAVLGLVSLELFLRMKNPYRLWKDAFNESSVCEPDELRGWRPKPNIEFDFYHRYLKGKTRISQNSLGLRSSVDYNPKKRDDSYRILVFGETTLIGWEMHENQTICRLLERRLAPRINHKKVEVIPVAARNYSLGQLFTWYKTVFHEFEYDLLLYYFNENNPRRSITFHESGKPILLKQPVYAWSREEGLTLLQPPPMNHSNDMAFLNQEGKVELKQGKTIKTPHAWMRDHLHIYCALTDLFQGKTRLRKFKDRQEIKNIEKCKAPGDEEALPYQWETCGRIFHEWAKLVQEKSVPMILVSNLQYYHAGNNWLLSGTKHEWGFNYEDIPSRRYLRRITEGTGINFLDTYQYTYENRIDTTDFYTHPRYAYFNAKGAEFQAKYILEVLSPYLPDDKGS